MEKIIASLLALTAIIALSCWLGFSNEHTVTVTAYGIEKITNTHGNKYSFTTDVYYLLSTDHGTYHIGIDGKTPALMQGTGGRTLKVLTDAGGGHTRIRRLTPTECARLQTVPDWYKWVVSETQQYKMLGNGWTVEVIKHIFSFLPDRFKQ